MTAQKLYETLSFILATDRNLRLQTKLEAIRDNLASLVNSPANTQYQSTLAGALMQFTDASHELAVDITPQQADAIAELGGAAYFDPSMADKVQASVSANAMTPSVARDFAQELAGQRARFLEAVEATVAGLKQLGISSPEIAPGSADMAFLIPRNLFDNNLRQFSKELNFINRLVEEISEATTGEVQAVTLEGLSSSIPTVLLMAKLEVIAKIADIVEKFLSAWEKIKKIRDARSNLEELGIKGKLLEELDERITTTVEEVVEESTHQILIGYPKDEARKRELETALRRDTTRLFGQIERGLVIQFRAKPNETANEEEQKQLDEVQRVARVIQFPTPSSTPILLTNGEALEGDIAAVVTTTKRTSKKTTSKKTTIEPRLPENFRRFRHDEDE